ncbi:MAG: glycosyltransferase family 39 protein [Phycisphaeraceae bacterium]|nr:glycosyltransferase family 39 protein [Phycisphaeraceae bacterium]
MSHREPPKIQTENEQRAKWLFWGVVLGVLVLRAVYLKWFCPFTLVEDEAHYWEWSRRLGLSYYTKGPGVAWVIAASTWVFGVSEFAVRLPAVIAGSVAAGFVGGLGRLMAGTWRAALLSAACFLLLPAFQVLGLTMTIDGPYAACWAAAAFAGWRAIGRGERAWWVGVGVAVGVGALFKYTILLIVPGVVLCAVLRAARRREGWAGLAMGMGVAAVAAAVCLLPVIVWNAERGWPTVRHLLGHLGVVGGDMPVTQGRGGWKYSPMWTLTHIGTQIGLVGPALLLMGWLPRGAEGTRGIDLSVREGVEYLYAVGAPVLAFYLALTLVTLPEGNWPIAGYMSLCVLAGWRVSQMATGEGVRARFVRVAWRGVVAMGVIVAAALPSLSLVARLPLIGGTIPIHRFTGAKDMAAHVERIGASLREETGEEPFVMAVHYGRASQLAFYLSGRPVVYCAGSLVQQGRRTQYDFWEDTDLSRVQGLLVGRPGVVVGATAGVWASVFDAVRDEGRLDGDGKRARPAFGGVGFRGFPEGGVPDDPAGHR